MQKLVLGVFQKEGCVCGLFAGDTCYYEVIVLTLSDVSFPASVSPLEEQCSVNSAKDGPWSLSSLLHVVNNLFTASLTYKKTLL